MAYQYGCRQGHIYPVGTYLSKDAAIHNGKKESFHRAGKYEIRVFQSRHPNNHNRNRLEEILCIESPYKGKLKSLSDSEILTTIKNIPHAK